MPRRVVTTLVLLAVAATVLSGCAVVNDHAQQDARAQRVAEAISYPPQSDAISWARAASGSVVVLRAEDLEVDRGDAAAANARLLFLVHTVESSDFFSDHAARDDCYHLDLNRYGAIGRPVHTRCPADLSPLRIPPPPPIARIPANFDRVLAAALGRPPSSAAALRQSLRARLSSPRPAVEVSVDGSEVGVAIRDDTGNCLFGARLHGTVRVYYPPDVQVAPGELSCDPATARGPVVESAH